MAQAGTTHLIGARAIGIWIAVALAGAALLVLSARVQIPMYPAPMTMQLAAVLGLATLLPKQSALSPITLYLGLGLCGVPVFAGASAGPAYFVGPTGGYLLGFFLASLVIVGLRHKANSLILTLAAVPAGAALILGLGWAWLSVLIGPQPAWTAGVLPFLVGDAVKSGLVMILVAAFHSHRQKGTLQ